MKNERKLSLRKSAPVGLVLLGWLSGESFYQGRPTAFWSLQLRSARAKAISVFSPSPSPLPSWTGPTPRSTLSGRACTG